jgi:hypothetical protein
MVRSVAEGMRIVPISAAIILIGLSYGLAVILYRLHIIPMTGIIWIGSVIVPPA